MSALPQNWPGERPCRPLCHKEGPGNRLHPARKGHLSLNITNRLPSSDSRPDESRSSTTQTDPLAPANDSTPTIDLSASDSLRHKPLLPSGMPPQETFPPRMANTSMEGQLAKRMMRPSKPSNIRILNRLPDCIRLEIINPKNLRLNIRG